VNEDSPKTDQAAIVKKLSTGIPEKKVIRRDDNDKERRPVPSGFTQLLGFLRQAKWTMRVNDRSHSVTDPHVALPA
jgi:hypothetical protein